MKIILVHDKTFIFDSSKMLKVKNKHFKSCLNGLYGYLPENLDSTGKYIEVRVRFAAKA